MDKFEKRCKENDRRESQGKSIKRKKKVQKRNKPLRVHQGLFSAKLIRKIATTMNQTSRPSITTTVGSTLINTMNRARKIQMKQSLIVT